MKLYTFVVHYLQICMKEYGCCPKFKVVYYKCVKFHKNPISGLGGVALTRYMDGRTDRLIPIYPPNFVCGLLDFYETLHICSTLPADMHEGIWLLSKI
jgi:hypothetical protein